MPTGHSVNYFINVNRDRRHLPFCQCYKSHHQQLSEYKFVQGKWTMIYKISKRRNENNLAAICQINWYTLGSSLKSCLFKSKCYPGIYSSNSEISLKINLFTLHSQSFSLICIVLSDKRQALQLVTATQAINTQGFLIQMTHLELFLYIFSLVVSSLFRNTAVYKSKMGCRNKQV